MEFAPWLSRTRYNLMIELRSVALPAIIFDCSWVWTNSLLHALELCILTTKSIMATAITAPKPKLPSIHGSPSKPGLSPKPWLPAEPGLPSMPQQPTVSHGWAGAYLWTSWICSICKLCGTPSVFSRKHREIISPCDLMFRISSARLPLVSFKMKESRGYNGAHDEHLLRWSNF